MNRKYQSKKNPRREFILIIVLSVIIIVGLLMFYEKEEWFKFSFLFSYFPIVIIREIIKYNKEKRAQSSEVK